MAELIGWVDPEGLDDLWPDSVTLDPEALASILTVAWETCEAYAPALPAGADIPARYRMAQILQAKAIWAMQRQGPGESFDGNGFSVAIYPLDARIRSLLRPRRMFGGLR